MNDVVTVQTFSRWETSSLLRKLRGHNAYAIQVGEQQWLVRSLLGPSASVAEIERLLDEWAAEQGTQPPALQVDSAQAAAAQT